MNKPDFDIVSEDLAVVDWSDCRLVMEVNSQYFHYVVISGTKSVIALKYYHFTSHNNLELTNILGEIIKEDIVLKERMKDSVVIYNHPENCLVPDQYFNPDFNKEMLELVHGDINKGTIHSEKIQGWDIFNIFRLPQDLHEFFQHYFLCGMPRHLYTLWLECHREPAITAHDNVCVLFYPNEILAVVLAGGQLQVVQSFPYKTAEDIAWHLLNIYKRCGLDQSKTPLVIGGLINHNSAMHEELKKYFLDVRPYPLPEGLIVTEQVNSFPGHFFSPLLKLALCVS
ncbi:MAG: DUF3822 family protein [Chitinophagaceae bacterium]